MTPCDSLCTLYNPLMMSWPYKPLWPLYGHFGPFSLVATSQQTNQIIGMQEPNLHETVIFIPTNLLKSLHAFEIDE